MPSLLFSEPWEAVSDDASVFEAEVRREVTRGHPLFGIVCRALARRIDRDDIAVACLDGSDRFAVVHHTWSGEPETDPSCPHTTFYPNEAALQRQVDLDHAEYV